MAKITIGVRIEPDVKAYLEKQAEKDARSISWLADKILTEWVKKEKGNE